MEEDDGKKLEKLSKFVANMGCHVMITPANMARRNGIKFGPVEDDEPNPCLSTDMSWTSYGMSTCLPKVPKKDRRNL